ncbi:Cysteine and glycine-rich protein 1 [Borealophlyctis nickersoniae]|nr:Cysteine and glycine-rich protein 1 [Borealophlyctis nickersoniae]
MAKRIARRVMERCYGYGGGAGVLGTDSTIAENQRFTPSSSTPVSRSTSSAAISNAGSTSPSRRGSTSTGGGSKPRFGGADNCPRCDKAVYFAEQVIGPLGVKYHKTCFKCTECNKSVDSTSVADKDGVIFCKGCHAKKFGPKGYGFGGGAAFLTTEGRS